MYMYVRKKNNVDALITEWIPIVSMQKKRGKKIEHDLYESLLLTHQHRFRSFFYYYHLGNRMGVFFL
jgi:hypothetical protein